MKKNAGHDESVKTPPEAAQTVDGAAEAGVANKPTDVGVEASPNAGAGGNATDDAGVIKDEAAAGPDLTARVAELEKLNASLQDQYLRKAADFDNYRKRMIREKQEAIDFANTNLLVDLVQILDNFDRAIDSVGSPEAGSPAAAFAEGVRMIRTQMGGMLESKYGLVYYPSKGVTFDPMIHEAISTVPSADVKEATVTEEYAKGYKLKDRVIRLAKVIVAMPAQA